MSANDLGCVKTRCFMVLAYNLTRVMNVMGIQPLMTAIQA